MNITRHYKDELEKLDQVDKIRVERHMAVTIVCVSWFEEQYLKYSTAEVELVQNKRWAD